MNNWWQKPVLTPFCNQKRYFCVFLTILCTNPYQKTQNSKKIENYEVFHKSTKCFNIQLGVEKNFGFFRFCFWPLFVTKNSIFVFFWPFYTQILTKNPKLKKDRKLWGFSQNYKMFQYTTWGRKIFFNFQILFLTPFCNQKSYFVYVFWPFYAQILTKTPQKPKNQKITKTMRFFTKVQNVSIYNLGSKNIF